MFGAGLLLLGAGLAVIFATTHGTRVGLVLAVAGVILLRAWRNL